MSRPRAGPSCTVAPEGPRGDRVARLRQTRDKPRRVLSIAASTWPGTDKPRQECTRHYKDLDTTHTVRTAVKGQRPAPAHSTPHHSTLASLMRCEKSVVAHPEWPPNTERGGAKTEQADVHDNQRSGEGSPATKVWQAPCAVLLHQNAGAHVEEMLYKFSRSHANVDDYTE